MICRFCNKPFTKISRVSYVKDDWYRCNDCAVHYKTKDGNIIYMLLHSSKYIIDVDLITNISRVFRTVIDTTTMTINEIWTESASGDVIFNSTNIAIINSFTPSNIDAKVEVLLLLS